MWQESACFLCWHPLLGAAPREDEPPVVVQGGVGATPQHHHPVGVRQGHNVPPLNLIKKTEIEVEMVRRSVVWRNVECWNNKGKNVIWFKLHEESAVFFIQ